MKNYLKKAASGLVLISLFGIGCKKDSAIPVPQQQAQAFTVTSDTFKDGVVDHNLILREDLHRPSLTWKNQPSGTKGFWVIMDDDQKYVYWTERDTEQSVGWKQKNHGVHYPPQLWFEIPEGNQSSSNTAVIEVFALACSSTDFEKRVNEELGKDGKLVKKLSRAELRELVKKYNFSNMILGSAKVSYKVKRRSVESTSIPNSAPTVTEPIKSSASTVTLIQKREPVTIPILQLRELTASAAKFASQTGLRGATFQCAKVVQGIEENFDEVVDYVIVGNIGMIVNITPSTTYKARVYIEEGGVKKYSNVVTFTTANE